MSACRSCGADIVWAVVEPDGKRMPLDAQPDPDGNVEALAYAPDGTLHVRVTTAEDRAQPSFDDPEFQGRMYRSHFATCPDADQWRRDA